MRDCDGNTAVVWNIRGRDGGEKVRERGPRKGVKTSQWERSNRRL